LRGDETMEYSAKRIGKMAFYAKTPSGHDIHMDAKESSGGDGSAPTPMETVMAALFNGCCFDSFQDEGYRLRVLDFCKL